MAARHEEITEKLRRAIDREDYAVGSPLPTEADLAARYGISRGTGRQAVAALTVEVLQGSPQGLRRVTLTSRHSQSLPSCAALDVISFGWVSCRSWQGSLSGWCRTSCGRCSSG
ncbi:GntR family transcriptional regulator, partial [Streptomyces lydicus]|uniref:GntR family transcriptional regulator n=1 Tax=Streptomyces lydicus TaxID=47763 RepID=UPI003695FE46